MQNNNINDSLIMFLNLFMKSSWRFSEKFYKLNKFMKNKFMNI